MDLEHSIDQKFIDRELSEVKTEREGEKEIGNCCLCDEPTELFCKSCATDWGEFEPTYYCDAHYETTVLTGNCCGGNELLYNPVNP